MRILIIENEEWVMHIIKRGLEEAGYAIDMARCGQEGEILAQSVPYDLTIIDSILPDRDGVDICRSLRSKSISTLIMILSDKCNSHDKAIGLNSGADDYMTKPFDFEELYARIRALLRRKENERIPIIKVGDIVMDTVSRELWQRGRRIQLSGRECAILELLMEHSGSVVTRTMMEQHIWNLSYDSSSNLIDVYIRKLRIKLDDREHQSLIQTVRGAGYKLKPQL